MSATLRAILLVVAVALASYTGCAYNGKQPPTKTDNSASSGSTVVDDGVKQVEGGLVGIEQGPLNDVQKIHAATIRTGTSNVRFGAIILRKAYADAAKLNEPTRRAQANRIGWGMIVGIGVLAVGIGLSIGHPLIGLPLAAIGGTFSIGLLALNTLTRPMEVFAYCMIPVGVAAAVYYFWMRLKNRKELAVEKVATKELVETITEVRKELGPVTDAKLFGNGDDNDTGTVGLIQSAPTTELVTKAKEEIAENGKGGLKVVPGLAGWESKENRIAAGSITWDLPPSVTKNPRRCRKAKKKRSDR